MESFKEVVKGYQTLIANGTTRDEVITNLHSQGFNIIDSMKIIRVLYNIHLQEAKQIMADHPAWADFVRRWEPVQDALFEAILDDMKKDGHEQ